MTHLTVSQRTLLGRTYQSAQAIASSGTTEGTDEFCRTIPIFGANFESCNIFPAEMRFFRLFHTPPPNRFFRHFSATTEVHDVARFQKQPRNGIVRHLGTQNVSKRPEACNHRKKNASKADSPFFPYILMRFIREEPRVPETSPISMKLVMFCWAISTQSSTTQLPSNCSGSDCST